MRYFKRTLDNGWYRTINLDRQLRHTHYYSVVFTVSVATPHLIARPAESFCCINPERLEELI